MWDFDDRFKYSERFPATSDLEINSPNMVGVCDGSKLVDVIQPFDHYFRVVIPEDDTLQHSQGIGGNNDSY